MQDLAELLDAHVCDPRCSRTTHTQTVLVEFDDVASVAAELGTLSGVRDLLAARGLVMLEGEPTPRFPAPDREPRPWSVRYAQGSGAGARSFAPGASGARPLRRGWLSRILGEDR